MPDTSPIPQGNDFQITLHDGRHLACALYGDPMGRPLYFFHGFPGSRVQAAFLHEKALAASVCLVAMDRPGFGRSTLEPERTLLSWADDVAQLADQLGHTRFDVIGVSCGGAYALACASALPQRVSAVALMGGMGPMDLPAIRAGQLRVLTVMFTLARWHEGLVSPMLALDRAHVRRDPRKAVKALAGLLSVPDQQLLAGNPMVAECFGASLAEAYRQGIAGVRREAHLIGRARDHALGDIQVPVHLFQGRLDRHVPPAMGRYLAQVVPKATLHFREEEGHLSIVWNCFDEAVRVLAA